MIKCGFLKNDFISYTPLDIAHGTTPQSPYFKTRFEISNEFSKDRSFGHQKLEKLNVSAWKNKIKGQTNSKWFFQANVSSKKRTNILTLLLVDMFSFIFRKKVKTPKRHFEINWPLAWLDLAWEISAWSHHYFLTNLIISRSLIFAISLCLRPLGF